VSAADSGHEARITELESRLAFQDLTIEELDLVIYRQQEEINALLREMKIMRQCLENLKTESKDCECG
jgi:uncharacterized coiled-coil protein SlyX